MKLNIIQIIVLSLLQGVTELFPISSLGHSVILPGLLGWSEFATDTACGGKSCYLPFLTALHLGTSVALIIYFWRDWVQVVRTMIKSIKDGEVKKGTEEWVSWLIIIGCIPTAIVGVVLQHPLEHLFGSPVIAATFLVVNGSVLFLGEQMRRRAEGQAAHLPPKEREALFRPLSSLTWKEAVVVGLAQSLALIPGFSRSGTTIVAGLGVKLTHEDAARYSFLLGTPIILGANIIEVPSLFTLPVGSLLIVLFGMILCGIAAYVSTKFLTAYFETGRLYPFAYYCWGAGLISLFLLYFVLHIR